jgi:acyl carrier protein
MQAMSDSQILDLVRESVANTMPEMTKELDQLTLETSLTSVGLDSVGMLEAAAYIEDKLGADFPDDRLARVENVSDLAALIRDHLSR